ncbi:hypothetical protein BAE44_0016704 [Dichanthelium oligosanthes]|uniref:Uncharacterized protein n=1 Tax=Dichanthelium oligosanthes TaxID=888268 RepID=A0A1E5VAW5_9POAL|nr:hypothetical protein BAE44_0016704 [Dichanthelium oligosanthes]
MPVLDEDRAGAGGGVDDYSDRQRCSCLPFCFWGASRGGSKAKRRRRRRFRLRLSWLTWPWFRKSSRKGAGGDSDKGKKRRGRRLLLLLTTSLQPKKALASVVSGDSALLPAKVGSFGDAKKQSNCKPRPTADDDGPSCSRQPQASTTAATASTRWSTAPAPSRTETSQPSLRPTDGGPAVAGRIWRAPSRRHSFHQSDSAERPDGAGGLWTAATTLGVIVFFGRVTAVFFLCSCLYGVRFVRARVGGASASARAKANGSGVTAGSSISSSRRFGDPVGVAAEKVVAEPCATEECKKKVVMAGLLDRAGKTTPSSRFGR